MSRLIKAINNGKGSVFYQLVKLGYTTTKAKELAELQNFTYHDVSNLLQHYLQQSAKEYIVKTIPEATGEDSFKSLYLPVLDEYYTVTKRSKV
jgi:hypothetical protein